MKTTSFKKYNEISIIALYFIGVLTNNYWGFPYLQQFFGIILIFFLPGIMLYPFLGIKSSFKKPFDWLISTPISLAIISTGILLFSRFFSGIYTQSNQITLLVLINIIIYLITLLLRRKSVQQSEDIKFNWKPLIILILPIIIHIISWIIYPYFPGDDTYVLADTLRQSIDSQSVIQPVLERRPLLTPLLLLIFHGTSLSISSIFMYVIPLAVTLSFLLAASLINKAKEKIEWKDFLPAIMFIASPYLMFQLAYSIPQSFILIWIMPVILLAINSIKEENPNQLATAFFLSFIAINFHELGFVLLLISITSSSIFLIKNYKNNRVAYQKNFLLSLIIFLPYMIILQIGEKIKGLWAVITHVTKGSALEFNFRWWYVDHYENPDGLIFSYPGFKGILWYGYLGVLIALLFLITLFVYLKVKKSNRIKIEHLPLILYLTLFFFLSEIYPRVFKIAFLPERAWTFLSVGLFVYFLLLVQDVKNAKPSYYKPILTISVLFVIIGALATVYLSYNRGILVSKDDQNGINFIKNNTPKNAIIVSTQAYDKGIAVFSDRKFYELDSSSKNFPKGNFNLKDLSEYTAAEFDSQTKSLPAKQTVTVVNLRGDIISQTETPLINKVPNEKVTPIYFVYSLNRFKNTDFLGRPEYFVMNDISNKDRYFSDEFAETAVFNDRKVIIFKLK